MSKRGPATPEQLLAELENNPESFTRRGRAHALLQHYFAGFPVDTLTSLLSKSSPVIRCSAIWIASELGVRATALLPYAVNLLSDENKATRYYAMDVVVTCATDERVLAFPALLRMLRDDDKDVRIRAMRLLANASNQQLEAALAFHRRREGDASTDVRGISWLLGQQAVPPITTLSDAVELRYAAIQGARQLPGSTHEIGKFSSCLDDEIAEFVRQSKAFHNLA